MEPINMQDQRSHQEGSMVMLPTYQLTTKLIDFLLVTFLMYTSKQYIMIIHMPRHRQCHASQQSTDSSSLAGPVICPPGNATQHCVTGCTSNNTMKTGQNCITVDSVGAMQLLQLCSTAQSVGTVNIGTTTSQSLLPSLSATLMTPLASLLSSIVPHLNLQSNSQSFIIPGTPSNATPSAYQ